MDPRPCPTCGELNKRTRFSFYCPEHDRDSKFKRNLEAEMFVEPNPLHAVIVGGPADRARELRAPLAQQYGIIVTHHYEWMKPKQADRPLPEGTDLVIVLADLAGGHAYTGKVIEKAKACGARVVRTSHKKSTLFRDLERLGIEPSAVRAVPACRALGEPLALETPDPLPEAAPVPKDEPSASLENLAQVAAINAATVEAQTKALADAEALARQYADEAHAATQRAHGLEQELKVLHDNALRDHQTIRGYEERLEERAHRIQELNDELADLQSELDKLRTDDPPDVAALRSKVLTLVAVLEAGAMEVDEVLPALRRVLG